MPNGNSHTVDLLQWLLGEVTAISGHASTDLLADTIEVVTEDATLSLRGDLTVTHRDGRIQAIAERKAPVRWANLHAQTDPTTVAASVS